MRRFNPKKYERAPGGERAGASVHNHIPVTMRIYVVTLTACTLCIGAGMFAGTRTAADACGDIPGFREAEGTYVPDWPEPGVANREWHLPWPEMPGLDENPVTPEKVHLGRLLFFDPIVSGDNTTSCAACHHPDFGLADGRKKALGFGARGAATDRTGGMRLGRASPSLWNAAFNANQFWDGRAQDLEHQASFPIQAPDEMNQDPDELVWELQEVPAYVTLFEKTFGGAGRDAVTYERAVQAITSFERTFLSLDAPFDRYARGAENALTEQQQRGFALFRSKRLNCIACHKLPTFSDTELHVIGVPEEGDRDPGRAKVPGEGPFGAFKVPTLRNITRTAPYMHNGALETLEEVIDFYADGAGLALNDPAYEIDAEIAPFVIDDAEKAALLAFFEALTDESLKPAPPAAVPSGLPVTAVSP
ncbi:MAG: cytochrome-c peroxidase [Candidatus Hydrogenedentota bacterium]